MERVERENFSLGWQRNPGILEIDPQYAAARPDTLRCVQRPGARARPEIENALALLEQTNAFVDLLELVDRASRVAFAPRSASEVILLAARGQLALFGGFRRGFFFGRRLRKRHGRLLDGALHRDKTVARTRNAAVDEDDVLVG